MNALPVQLGPGDAVGIVACSNPLSGMQRQEVVQLLSLLKGDFSLIPYCGRTLWADCLQDRPALLRAQDLMELYANPCIKAIFDVSGGDLANEILPYLDYEEIAADNKPFFGYSDLTTVINTILQRTGKPSVLYQILNLVRDNALLRQKYFHSTMLGGRSSSDEIDWNFVQGDYMQGILAGGNLRCLLKLAGTQYFPELTGRLLFLESLGGGPEQITTYLCQLKQMNAFDKISGLLLGTFTRLEEQIGTEASISLIRHAIDKPNLPIAKTQQIGHSSDSRCLVIGAQYTCRRLTSGRGMLNYIQ